jgi:hypothetical protein
MTSMPIDGSGSPSLACLSFVRIRKLAQYFFSGQGINEHELLHKIFVNNIAYRSRANRELLALFQIKRRFRFMCHEFDLIYKKYI